MAIRKNIMIQQSQRPTERLRLGLVILMTYVLGIFFDFSSTKNAYKNVCFSFINLRMYKDPLSEIRVIVVQLAVIICDHNRTSENVLTLSNMITMAILYCVQKFINIGLNIF